jgi:hypothetical protein
LDREGEINLLRLSGTELRQSRLYWHQFGINLLISRRGRSAGLSHQAGDCFESSDRVISSYKNEIVTALSIEKSYRNQRAHPLMLRAIAAAKRKNDRIDAGKIADCLRCDFLP